MDAHFPGFCFCFLVLLKDFFNDTPLSFVLLFCFNNSNWIFSHFKSKSIWKIGHSSQPIHNDGIIQYNGPSKRWLVEYLFCEKRVSEHISLIWILHDNPAKLGFLSVLLIPYLSFTNEETEIQGHQLTRSSQGSRQYWNQVSNLALLSLSFPQCRLFQFLNLFTP